MELKNRHHKMLEKASAILEIPKEKLALAIINGKGKLETDSHELEVRGTRTSPHGELYLIQIKEKNTRKCVLDTPVLLVSPKRGRYTKRQVI